MTKVELMIFVENRTSDLREDIFFDKPREEVTDADILPVVKKIVIEGFLYQGQTYVNNYYAPSSIKEIRWLKRDA